MTNGYIGDRRGGTGVTCPPQNLLWGVSTPTKYYSGRRMIQAFMIVQEATWHSQLLQVHTRQQANSRRVSIFEIASEVTSEHQILEIFWGGGRGACPQTSLAAAQLQLCAPQSQVSSAIHGLCFKSHRLTCNSCMNMFSPSKHPKWRQPVLC